MAAPIFQVMEAFRNALLMKERASATRLVKAYGETYKAILPEIEALQREIESLEGDKKAWRKYKLTRLQALKRQIEFEVNKYAAYADVEITQAARTAMRLGLTDARLMVQAKFPQMVAPTVMSSWSRLPVEAVETLLGFTGPNSPLRASLEKLGPAVADAVEEKLVQGVAMGLGPRETGRAISQELGQGLTWSLRTARTTTIYSYREATRASYLANQDIVTGWIWRCARQDRTCMSCIAMDGEEFPLDETLNDHDNGRCYPEPKLKTFEELGIPIEEPPPAVEDNAREWFESQPEAMQRQMMGPGKYEAWKAGKFDLRDLTTTGEHPAWGEIRVETPLKDLLEVDRAA